MHVDSITTEDSLRYFIAHHPLIDNHAHPLLQEQHERDFPLELIISEASGAALEDAKHTLAGMRAVKMLAEELGMEPTWEAVKEARKKMDRTKWTKKCFAGVQSVLFDDGFASSQTIDYKAHDKYTMNPAKRIVRVEAEAELALKDCQFTSLEEIRRMVSELVSKPDVVGYKSVVCYRTGLDVDVTTSSAKGYAGLEAYLSRREKGGEHSEKFREKALNDWIVHTACDALRGTGKPFQFHTGLGDIDMDLKKSNPVLLQPLIKARPDVNFVLLHSSYPFTREAGYLAAMHKNVYLDFGEVFPMLSADGQKSVIKEMMELVPTNKLLWSSDGHMFPETFYLANRQVREVLTEILVKRTRKDILTLRQAGTIVENILFKNANRLYSLGLEPNWSAQQTIPPSITSATTLAVGASAPPSSGISRFEEIFSRIPLPKFVRLQWVDNTNALRLRVMPTQAVKSMFEKDGNCHVRITLAARSLLHDDKSVPDQEVAGMDIAVPDWSSLRTMGTAAGSQTGSHAAVMCNIKAQDHADPFLSPRAVLEVAIKKAQAEEIELLVGFETEVVFLKQATSDEAFPYHAWSVSTALSTQMTEMMDEIITALQDARIEVLMYHPESADRQFEIVTGPLPPMEAVDALYHTREIIRTIAARRGYLATLHPKPYKEQAGSAAHMHFSLSKGADKQDAFTAGMLNNLKTIVAFGMPTLASYKRSVENAWTGGRYICWGLENRETPLRKVVSDTAERWELRCVDGTANMYLLLSCVIAMGLLGVRDKLSLPPSVNTNPTTLSPEALQELEVTELLPGTLQEALEWLDQVKWGQQEAWLEVAAKKHSLVKTAEIEYLAKMGKDEQDAWELARY